MSKALHDSVLNLLKLLNFDFNADPDPAFHSNADPDPAFHSDAYPDPAFQSKADLDPASNNNADPCGSGSATFIFVYLYTLLQEGKVQSFSTDASRDFFSLPRVSVS